jgi:hypothetical protein
MPDDQDQDNPPVAVPSAVPSPTARPKCGLVMPISAIGNCTASHWADVKAILTEAVEAAGFEANLVSFANESRIIQNAIVENLYGNDMVVCDVSCKNPNVMFELGLRLAFDRPTVVAKDNETDYAFDTSPIVHLPYPQSLRYAQIVEFKKELATQVKSTYEAAKDPSYKSFVKTFGITKVATIETKEVSREDYIIQQLKEIRAAISGMGEGTQVHQSSGGSLAKGLLSVILSAEPILAMLNAEQRECLCQISVDFVCQHCAGRDYNLNKAVFHVDERFLKQCPSASSLYPDTRKGLVQAAVKWCYDNLALGGSS